MYTIYGLAGGGPSVTLTVVAGTVSSNDAVLTWSAPVGQTLVGSTPYKVYLTPNGGFESLIATISGTSYTLLELAAETIYSFRVTADIVTTAVGDGSFTTLVAPDLPELVRMTVWGASQDYSSMANNDGNFPFNPPSGTQQPLTVIADIKNLEPDPVIAVDYYFESLNDPAAPILGIGVKSAGVWATDTTQIDFPSVAGLPAGGLKPAISNKLTLGAPLAPDAYMTAQSCYGTGKISVFRSLDGPAYPSGMIGAGYRMVAGNKIGIDTNTLQRTLDIGLMNSNVFGYLAPTATPKLLVMLGGDSTVAQQNSYANPTREGVIYAANATARSASKNIRYWSTGNGGQSSAHSRARLRSNLPFLPGRAGLVLLLVASYNSRFTIVGQADANWLEYLVVKSEVEALGLKCRSLILSPVGAGATATMIAEWATMAAHVDAEGGVNCINAISANGVTIDANKSGDGIHLNYDGIAAQGPALHARTYACAQSIGWAI